MTGLLLVVGDAKYDSNAMDGRNVVVWSASGGGSSILIHREESVHAW